MNRIEVSDEQYEFIQALRAGIAESVVGDYGYVRERDAVQFLIDNLDEDVDVEVDVAAESAAIADVTASVEAALAGEADPTAETVTYEEAEATEEPADEPDSEPPEDAPDEDDTEETDTAEEGDADESGGAADDDDMLTEMMNLLETHDDKWVESSAADYRYSVELPDGTTEDVQTKDDVRALLFQHYR